MCLISQTRHDVSQFRWQNLTAIHRDQLTHLHCGPAHPRKLIRNPCHIARCHQQITHIWSRPATNLPYCAGCNVPSNACRHAAQTRDTGQAACRNSQGVGRRFRVSHQFSPKLRSGSTFDLTFQILSDPASVEVPALRNHLMLGNKTSVHKPGVKGSVAFYSLKTLGGCRITPCSFCGFDCPALNVPVRRNAFPLAV